MKTEVWKIETDREQKTSLKMNLVTCRHRKTWRRRCTRQSWRRWNYNVQSYTSYRTLNDYINDWLPSHTTNEQEGHIYHQTNRLAPPLTLQLLLTWLSLRSLFIWRVLNHCLFGPYTLVSILLLLSSICGDLVNTVSVRGWLGRDWFLHTGPWSSQYLIMKKSFLFRGIIWRNQ